MDGFPVTAAAPVATTRAAPAERLALLFDAHHARLYRLARRLTSSADAALDLVQDTFLRAARAPRAIPIGASAEEAWLVRVLVNLRRDAWRKEAVRSKHDRMFSDATQVDQRQEAALIARTIVWSALDVLTPRRRAVVVMHDLEGLGVPAVASLLGISAVTVRWHLSRAHRELSRMLGAPMRAQS